MTRGSKFRRFVGKLALVCLLSVTVLAVSFEVYLREKGYLQAEPAPYPCVTGDSVLNHVFQASCSGVASAKLIKTDRDATYHTNALGYRGHAPEPGKRTLVAIGDSYTEGFGLDDAESFPAMLEKAIGGDWQVLDGGTVGFSPALYPAYFDRYFLLSKPEVVLLNLDLTDFTDDPYYLMVANYDPAGRPYMFPGREILPAWMMPYVYSGRSALLRFVHDELNAWNMIQVRREQEPKMDAWIHADKPLILREDLKAAHLEGCAKSAEAVAKNILLLKDHVAAVGARLVIHMYPPGTVVKSYEWLPQSISFVRNWDAKHRRDYSWSCGATPQIVGVMRAFAEREDIPFYDSYPDVLAQPDRADFYFRRDAHWNARGVKFVTERLAAKLQGILRTTRAGGEPTRKPEHKSRK